MGVVSDAAEHPADVLRRLGRLERELAELRSARRLESASIGGGGLTVKGGHIVVLDGDGNEAMRLSTGGLTLEGLLAVLGSVHVSGGGSVEVSGGGSVEVSGGGSIRADDTAGGLVFEVTTEPAGIFMRPELITAVAAQAFADRVRGDQVLDLVQTTRTTFGDLTGSPGPSVEVEVTEAGAMIVQMSALMVNGARTAGGPGQTFAEMGFEVSGASSLAASANRALIVGGPVSSAQPDGITVGATKTVFVSGLNPGVHTVTAKYTTEVFGVTAAGAFISRRDLVVTAF